MTREVLQAEYLIETPLDPARVAAIIAGEQSSGTFVKVAGETDELRARAAAEVVGLEELEPAPRPSLASAYLERRGETGPWRRARIRVAFPLDNIGVNLPTLAATVAGNLFDLGELTGLRLLRLALPPAYRRHYPSPALGVAGTRARLGVEGRPLFGTIIKPNVGLRSTELADLVEQLCEAGVDFVKDDEVAGNPVHAPLAERVPAVMARVRRYRDRTGREVMVAFNVSDELDAMRRHAELVEREGGSCVMASLNWCGLAALQSLRASTGLAIHGHRNGIGALMRHPALGIGIEAYQTLYRLTGLDHLHVHGIGGKFADDGEEVAAAARHCLSGLAPGPADDPGGGDRVLPVFSSGQWAGTLAATRDALAPLGGAGAADFLLLAGGGILAHPGGPAAGVASLRQAWAALSAGETLEGAAARRPELAAALAFFGPKAG
ncbi:ribulose-bisphosphate carboxylase large chain [Tistlia consotensis]|uniref:Ribulose-bisphosphate carboxylase large chain n=1 Tax=Tistlia consotensis USBA 355 TaxID=560819 RepID=A0A1Y6BIW0_9PROT|nr:RuBisCO large subunit C-terminal-like domain-containing protein [Tistlia consotensis]SMF13844.1 ribulose-bisphosphate carboxylase large chain [Tistlia consotensis USBA 355]SNR50136.1 ribulose-bisphosphate carboxylase large chain [Tistlia consotensis]